MKARPVDYAFLLLGLLGIWQCLFIYAGADALASPMTTLSRVVELTMTPRFWEHAASSGSALFYACLLALLGGLGVGAFLGANRLATEVGEPILATLYAIPKITLYPVVLLVFGLGISAKVAFGTLHGIFPVALFTIGAMKNVSVIHMKTARVLQLSSADTIRYVLLPATLPEIVTGLRIGFSATLLGTLIAELFASNQGIGFMLIRAMELHRVADIMALTLLLFAFAAAANSILLSVEHRLYHHA